MPDLITLITALLGGGLAGGYLQISSERRTLRSTRADLLRKLAAVEKARWANLADTGDAGGFKLAARELEVTAMITGFSQEVVHLYLVWAQVAAWESYEDFEHDPDPQAGGINGELADIVRSLAQLISDCAWHPVLIRRTRRARLKAIHVRIANLPNSMCSAASRTSWSREH